MSSEIPSQLGQQPKKVPSNTKGLQKSTRNTVLHKLGRCAEGCAFGSLTWLILDKTHGYDHQVSLIAFVTSTCALALITGIEHIKMRKGR